MNTIKNAQSPPTLENFHLSEKSKRNLILLTQAFELTLDELVSKAIRDIATCECLAMITPNIEK